jgi:CHAT domain-containing protein
MVRWARRAPKKDDLILLREIGLDPAVGLARALRTAGARNVLVTLWKLNDGEARDFMVEFYKTWLAQVRSDPAKALRDTQLSWLKQDDRRDPRVWAPYILIE